MKDHVKDFKSKKIIYRKMTQIGRLTLIMTLVESQYDVIIIR